MNRIKMKIISLALASVVGVAYAGADLAFAIKNNEDITSKGAEGTTSGSAINSDKSLKLTTSTSLLIDGIDFTEVTQDTYVDFLLDGKLISGNYIFTEGGYGDIHTAGTDEKYNILLNNHINGSGQYNTPDNFTVGKNDEVNLYIEAGSENSLGNIGLKHGSSINIYGDDSGHLNVMNIGLTDKEAVDNEPIKVDHITIQGANIHVMGSIGFAYMPWDVYGKEEIYNTYYINEINIIDATLELMGRIGLTTIGEVGTINIKGGNILTSGGVGTGDVQGTSTLKSHIGTINISGGTGDSFKLSEYDMNSSTAPIGTGVSIAMQSMEGQEDFVLTSSIDEINISGTSEYIMDLRTKKANIPAIGTGATASGGNQGKVKSAQSTIGAINISGDDNFKIKTGSTEMGYSIPGSNRSATIGTGFFYNGYSSIGSININGGTIEAVTNSAGAVIGTAGTGVGSSGGYEENYIREINITGGNIFAKNTYTGAAIGTGDANTRHIMGNSYGPNTITKDTGSHIGSINIYGGKVKAFGGANGGAAIGVGLSASPYTIVNAEGWYVEGTPEKIDMARVDSINITGGDVTAYGGRFGGAGIGNSFAEDSRVGEVNIGNNASVKAYAVSDIYSRFTPDDFNAWENINFYAGYLKQDNNSSFSVLPKTAEKHEEVYGTSYGSRYAIGFETDIINVNNGVVNAYLTDAPYYDENRDFGNTWEFEQDFNDTIQITAHEVNGDGKIQLELPYGYSSFAYNAPVGSSYYHVLEQEESEKYLEVIDEKESLASYKGYTKVPSLKTSRATWLAPADISSKPEVHVIYDGGKAITGTGVPNAIVNLQINNGEEVIYVDNILIGAEGNWSINVEDIGTLQTLVAGYTVVARQVEEGKAGSLEVNNYVKPIEVSINDIVTGSKSISGTSAPNGQIEITINGETYTIVADKDGGWKLDTSNVDLVIGEKVTANQIVVAVDGKELIGPKTNTTILKKPDGPSVNEMYHKYELISGNGIQNALVKLRIDTGTEIIVVDDIVVDENSAWSVAVKDIKALKELIAGYIVTAVQIADGKTESIEAKEYVKPHTVKINRVIASAMEITGIALPNAKVEVSINKAKNVYNVNADAKGVWKLDTSELDLAKDDVVFAKQTVLSVDNTKLVSAVESTTVIRKPEPPVINDAYEGALEIKGTSEPKAVVKIIINKGTTNEIILETIADDTGNWVWTVEKSLVKGDKIVASQTVNVKGDIYIASEFAETIVLPLEPTNPTDPTDPKPIAPIPEKPSRPTKPAKPTKPSEPINPDKPIEVNPDIPTEPTGPIEPTEQNPIVPIPEKPINPSIPMVVNPDTGEEEIAVPDNANFDKAINGDDGLIYLYDQDIPLGTVTVDEYIDGNFDNMIPFGSLNIEDDTQVVSVEAKEEVDDGKINPKTGTSLVYPIFITTLFVGGIIILLTQGRKKIH